MFKPTMGTWWLAERPEVQVPGYLQVDESHPWPWRLTVLGRLAEPDPGWDNTATLFGQTDRGLYTLSSASPGEMRRGGGGSEDIYAVEWHAPVLFAKDHVMPEVTFRHASFTYPHLLDWFRARFNGYVRPSGALPKDNSWEHLHEVELSSGATLSVALVRHRQLGWASKSQSWRAEYTLTSEAGFTFTELSKIQWGLARLHAIMLGTNVEESQTTLTHDPAPSWVEVVEASPPAGEDWNGISPLFNADEVDVGLFLRRWLDLSSSAPMIAAAAAPHAAIGSMHGDIQDLCNAVEWLFARIQGPEDRPVQPKDQVILDSMVGPTFNSDQRRRVKHLMTQPGQVTLEQKLVRLAGMMGEESSAWLLGSVTDWAHVISQVRNSLTHGSLVPGHDDVRLLGDAGLTLTTVLQFALLNHCSYTNALCPVPGEMLWSRGELMRGTRDAHIVYRSEGLATRSGGVGAAGTPAAEGRNGPLGS
jgi:ApeA N-terminal domain 1